jgi:hypothetical protein
MDSFFDPENKEEIIEKFRSLEASNREMQEYIEKIFPGWLVYSFDHYSMDYPHLTDNWLMICRLANTERKKIVLVREIFFDSIHSVLQTFAEVMTKKGYAVRRVGEFIPCSVCFSAIPNENIWLLLRNNGFPVPEKWDQICSSCKQ